ncbi:hypothetical protein AAHE18_09G088900 [Arachis hypogaea]|nr:uncharacterized protein DS421_9g266530 [Arachis hypogaea]
MLLIFKCVHFLVYFIFLNSTTELQRHMHNFSPPTYKKNNRLIHKNRIEMYLKLTKSSMSSSSSSSS